MKQSDISAVIEGIAPVIQDYVARSFAALNERIDTLEARPIPIPRDGISVREALRDQSNCIILTLSDGSTLNVGEVKDGKDGRDGVDGKDADPNAVMEMVVAEVGKIPPAKDGKDADTQAITEAVKAEVTPHLERELEQAIAKIPAPKDGKSPESDEVRALVVEVVAGAFAELTPPKDGKDGADGKPPDPEIIRDMVVAEVAKIPAAKDGKDGQDADPVAVAEILKSEVQPIIVEQVAAAAAALPLPKDGKDANPEEVALLIEAGVAKAVSEIAHPKDGKDGRDGIDGKDGVSLAGALINREGNLVVTLSDGTAHELGIVVGRDGKDGEKGKDGRDGLGFDDMTVEQSGDRGIVIRLARGDQVKEFPLSLPGFVYRGVWREGEFVKGDAVTWGGSLWIAQVDTKEKPEQGDAWRLAVKRGRDGKEGHPGKEGKPGTPGLKGDPGRDLR